MSRLTLEGHEIHPRHWTSLILRLHNYPVSQIVLAYITPTLSSLGPKICDQIEVSTHRISQASYIL